MSDIWMRRRRSGSAQRSISEAALAGNILLRHLCLHYQLPSVTSGRGTVSALIRIPVINSTPGRYLRRRQYGGRRAARRTCGGMWQRDAVTELSCGAIYPRSAEIFTFCVIIRNKCCGCV
ncbi:hypothetical protein EVAR_37744_1 [Eumeta japonica]|uniref:Uncharacterized protein n=1 Tax=Eumeta variegata TaxID=151549 RepID=A0A4C1WQI2_EUMVA|nr:hypothetical protein EVAR_37744_1 [Eumeta japonica]